MSTPSPILPHDCALCGAPTRWFADWAGETYCIDCARSALAHGHAHVHDCAEDCEAELTHLDGVTESLEIRCPSPCAEVA